MNKLYRNNKSGIIGGVCAGLSDYINVDIVILRLSFIVLSLFTGIVFLLYFILWLCLPTK